MLAPVPTVSPHKKLESGRLASPPPGGDAYPKAGKHHNVHDFRVSVVCHAV